MNEPTPKRYRWTFQGASFDFYRLCEILGLKSQPQIHAIKKIIRAGQSVKSTEQDIDEAIDCLVRWKEMRREDDQHKERSISQVSHRPEPTKGAKRASQTNPK